MRNDRNGGPEATATRPHVDLPVDGSVTGTAVFVHAFPEAEQEGAASVMVRALTRLGVAVVRLAVPPAGDGATAHHRMRQAEQAVIEASGFLETEYRAPCLLIGHSIGGSAVIEAAQALPAVRAVVTIGAPFIESPGGDHATERLGRLGAALLVMHSPTDLVVGIEHAGRIFRAARHPKSFVSLNEADHEISDEVDRLYVGSFLGAWAVRYMKLEYVRDQDLDPHDHRAVVRIGRERYRTEIRAGGHTMIGDEPVHLDGSDTGPTPYDMLIGGLGACTAITIRMYADRKEWPVEAVEVRLTHRKLPADQVDCLERARRGKVDVIDREVTLFGDLDEKQRGRLLEIANRCPVHRTIEAGPCVRTYERRPEGDV